MKTFTQNHPGQFQAIPENRANHSRAHGGSIADWLQDLVFRLLNKINDSDSRSLKTKPKSSKFKEEADFAIAGSLFCLLVSVSFCPDVNSRHLLFRYVLFLVLFLCFW